MRKILLSAILLATVSAAWPLCAHAQTFPFSVSPDPFEFGNVRLGTFKIMRATLTNVSSQGIGIGPITDAANDTITVGQNNCEENAVFPGDTCYIDIAFLASSTGSFFDTIILTSSSQRGRVLLNFSVTGTGASGVVSLSTSDIDFKTETVGKSSVEHEITLTNIGNDTLNISDISVGSDFSVTDTCGTSVAANADCMIGVTFSPTAAQGYSSSVTIDDDASDTPQTISVTGTGITATSPNASLSRHAVDFGNQLIDTTSAAQAVTLKNTGTATLTINAIAASNNYAVSDDCGASLAVDASCTLMITFGPTAEGEKDGSITIDDNASDSQDMIILTGTGSIHEGAKASLSTTDITFPPTAFNSTSEPQSFVITNSGDEDLTVTEISLDGPEDTNFAGVLDCLRTLRPGDTCTGEITFTPTNTGVTFTATIIITDNSPDSPQTITLTGTSDLAGGGCSLRR